MSSVNGRLSSCEEITEPLASKRAKPNSLRSRINAEAHKGTDIWLITLSDLLMLLVIFFVILFSMELQKHGPNIAVRAESKENQIEKKVSAPNTDPSMQSMSASIEKDLVAILNSEKSRQEITVRRVANLVTLTFPEQIVFDPGHAQLKRSAQTTLDKVASFIKERPNLIVEVQGHTDDQPINNSRYPSNWELSVDRATQVARVLIGLGVDPSRFSVKGFGEYHPLYPNDGDENRLKNRRVEIQFSISPQ
ncbi:MAG: flagellar motor protein MotB [Syntrophales bacterium]|nr:flagellar motor protein MotB [Syntrophales bacterium]